MSKQPTGAAWDQNVASKTGWCHFVQSKVWAEIRSEFSWPASRVELGKGLPLTIYSRSTKAFGKLHYVPKLATVNAKEAVGFTKALKQATGKGVAIRLEVDQPYDEAAHKALLKAGWQRVDHIQYERTVLINLKQPVKDIYASFKTRARWEISAAQRRGTVVKQVPATPENLQTFYDMMNVTSVRGNFRNRSQEFSMRYWQLFAKRGEGFLYFAYHEDDLLSAAFIIKIGTRAFYKDGASVRLKQNVFASRLMQWQVMQDMHDMGCDTYDMCGVPPADSTDPKYKGVGTFKTAFGEPVDLQGSYILPLNPRYKAWEKLEPKLMMAYLKLTNNLWY